MFPLLLPLRQDGCRSFLHWTEGTHLSYPLSLPSFPHSTSSQCRKYLNISCGYTRAPHSKSISLKMELSLSTSLIRFKRDKRLAVGWNGHIPVVRFKHGNEHVDIDENVWQEIKHKQQVINNFFMGTSQNEVIIYKSPTRLIVLRRRKSTRAALIFAERTPWPVKGNVKSYTLQTVGLRKAEVMQLLSHTHLVDKYIGLQKLFHKTMNAGGRKRTRN